MDQRENKFNVSQRVKRTRQLKINTNNLQKNRVVIDLQLPGPSGITAQTSAQQTEFEDYSDSDDGIPEQDKCFVCKRFSPDWRKRPFITILNLGQCEKCAGWVHLSFCSPIRVLRRVIISSVPSVLQNPTLNTIRSRLCK